MTYLIKADKINLNIAKKKILKDISLEIKNDDFITIIGPNGAGKSMLLKTLLGFFKINSGKISKKSNLKIGYVPQKLDLNKSMPITGRRFLTLNNNFEETQIKKIAQKLEIENILEQQIHILSGGQFQRILLARALLNNPEILILDEPAQNLDISGQINFYKLLKDIYEKDKIAILMVSHDLHLVMSSTKKVICLFHHICCAGEPNIVTQDPEFKTLFGQDITDLMAIYNHKHEKC